MNHHHTCSGDVAGKVVSGSGTDAGVGRVQRQVVPVGGEGAEWLCVIRVSSGGGGRVDGNRRGQGIPITAVHLHGEIRGDIGRLIGRRDVHREGHRRIR